MTLDTFNWPSIQCGHPPVPGPNCPGTYIEQVDLRHAANEEDNFLIDPTLKPIRTRELTLRRRSRVQPADGGGRAVFAQALRSHDRRHRRARARHRRGVSHHQSGRAHGRERAARLRRLHHLPEPAEADPQLRRRRVPLPETIQQQLAADLDVSLQPAVGQLLGSDQLRRERPQLAEREPVLRRPGTIRSITRASRCSACCRPIGRTCSSWKASTTRRGAPASGCTGSPRAARRCRPKCGRRAFRSTRSAAAILAARPRITRTDLLIQHDFRLFEQPSHQRRTEHREPVRPRHGDARLPGGEPRHLQRHAIRCSSAARSIRSRCRRRLRLLIVPIRASTRPTSGNSGARCACRSGTRSRAYTEARLRRADFPGLRRASRPPAASRRRGVSRAILKSLSCRGNSRKWM